VAGAVTPISAERYAIRFTASAEAYEKLRRAQDLLGHAVPSGDLAQVFDRALTLLVADLERKKFAATPKPGKTRDQSPNSRHIPAGVRRAVWTRITAGARSSPPTAGAATRGVFSSSITSNRSRRADGRRSRTSSFAVAPTIATRPRCSTRPSAATTPKIHPFRNG
jgi:hypothetical protein